MRTKSTQEVPTNTGCRKWRAGSLLLGVFLFALALTYSESLHQWVHDGAVKPGHQCVVTLLVAGQIDAVPEAISIQFTSGAVLLLAWPDIPALRSPSYSLPPGRGPPALLG
jgi:hypothetical protein